MNQPIIGTVTAKCECQSTLSFSIYPNPGKKSQLRVKVVDAHKEFTKTEYNHW